ncbi:YesL family protein [Salibacterium lacus]|uniref:YesL family protein n=1 Tax=Salibacterium lacus TaxID=1898109 RepID=A0ABW5T2A0_9BACI
MNRNKAGNIFHTTLNWITRLAYVNVLWILFSLAGLIAAGLFPATAAMFAVVRKWLTEDVEIPVLPTFWNAVRGEFLRANAIGYTALVPAYIFYVDFQFFSSIEGIVSFILLVVSGSLFFLYVITVLFLFPALAHYQVRIPEYFKQAFFIGAGSPAGVIMSVAACVVIVFLTAWFPALLFFFTGSVPAYVIMWSTLRTIRIMEEKHIKRKEGTES